MKSIAKFFNGETKTSLSKRMNRKVIQSLNAMSFLRRPHLHGLIAYIIIESMSVREEEMMISQLSFSMIVQLAQTLGLHREPLNMGLDYQEAEIRRRTWWHIVFLDSVCFSFTGLPPVVNWLYWDVKPIAEIKDPLLGSDEATQYLRDVASGARNPENCDDPIQGGNASYVSPVLVLNRGEHIHATYLARMNEIMANVRTVGNEELERCQRLFQDLKQELNSRIDRIPNTLADNGEMLPTTANDGYYEELLESAGITARAQMDSDEFELQRRAWLAFHAMARKWLKMGILRAYCVMHKPFLRDPGANVWEQVADSVLPYACEYLENFIDIVTNPVYQPFHWCWPGCHQPLHPLMVLLADLYQRPSSDKAMHFRILIDKTFELTTPDGGVSTAEDGVPVSRPLFQGGQTAWRILRMLREKAWRKAGFDPEVVWSSGSARWRSPDSTTPQPAPIPRSLPTVPTGGLAAGAGAGARADAGLDIEAEAAEAENALHDFDWRHWDETLGSFG